MNKMSKTIKVKDFNYQYAVNRNLIAEKEYLNKSIKKLDFDLPSFLRL